MVFVFLLSAVIFADVNLISYLDDDELDEIFEPLCDIDFDGEDDCDMFLSFASTNWHQNDYRGCIDQYKTALYCGCSGEDEGLEIYKYLGRAFLEMGILDSANWSFEKGLRINPDDESLLEVAAWNAGKLKNIKDQMYYLDRLLEINPKNTKALERMSDTYKTNQMYQEQIYILDLWLKIDPSNKKALSDKKFAFNKLGIDETSIDKDRWEKDKSNLQYGLDYASGLIDNDENELAIEICQELMAYDSNNNRLLKLISNAHLNLFEDNKALEYLEKLAQANQNDYNLKIEISEVAVNAGDYKKGYQWINQVISSNKMLGKAYFQRAEVLIGLVETFQSDEIDFCDKLIYDLAYDDYNASYGSGYLNAKTKMNQLYDYEYVSNKGDWFINADGLKKISPGSEKCKNLKNSNCYEWINRTVETKDK